MIKMNEETHNLFMMEQHQTSHLTWGWCMTWRLSGHVSRIPWGHTRSITYHNIGGCDESRGMAHSVASNRLTFSAPECHDISAISEPGKILQLVAGPCQLCLVTTKHQVMKTEMSRCWRKSQQNGQNEKDEVSKQRMKFSLFYCTQCCESHLIILCSLSENLTKQQQLLYSQL